MKYIKTFENFEPEATGLDTFWEDVLDGKIIRVTIKDVMKYLDEEIEIDPNDVKHLLIDVERDPNRVEAADLSYPIIVTKIGNEFISILDGPHRLVKALRDGVNINARILDLDLVPESWKKLFIRFAIVIKRAGLVKNNIELEKYQ
jgi:hypothetical protein